MFLAFADDIASITEEMNQTQKVLTRLEEEEAKKLVRTATQRKRKCKSSTQKHWSQ